MPSISWRTLKDSLVEKIELPKQTDIPKQEAHIATESRGRALVLVASYGGTKTWRGLKYRHGKPRSEKLGTFPTMNVEAAKTAARKYWERRDGHVEAGTFRDVAENWFKRHVEANELRSASEISRILGRPRDQEPVRGRKKKFRGYVYPQWGDRPFLEIRRSDVNALLDEVEDRHGKAQADAVLAVVRGIMSWHQSRDENYASPIVRGMKRDKRKAKTKARSRILDDAEIKALWEACDDLGAFGAICKLCLLSAQRRDKVAGMRWADLKDGVWIVPHAEREKGVGGSLKLPQMALDVIDAQPRIARHPYVFAGRGRVAFNAWSQRKSELDEALRKALPDMKPWVIHDLRRTARSLLSRAGVRPDVSERVLGHEIGGVEGVYDRHRYEAEKADALKRLATLVETILKPSQGNVVQLAKRRRK